MTETLSTEKKIFKVKDLHPAEYNPRTIKKEALNGLEKSLDKFGYLQHIVVNTRDGRNTIISGHQRIKALALDGNEKIECIVVDFDDVTEKAANVALNAESISGDWDLEGLEAILQELQVELPEFEDINLDGLADDLGIELDSLDDEGIDEKADEVPEAPEKTSIKLGDLIRLGEHFLLCGDSTKAEDVQKLMGEEKADMVFTDPPYGIKRDKGFSGAGGFEGKGKPIKRREYQDNWDNERPQKQCFDLILSQSKKAIIFGGNFFADFLPQGKHWLVWDKNNTMPTFGDCELAWTNIDRTSVKLYEFEYNGLIGKEESRVHPTQKPVGLFIAIFKDYEFETCFDPFLGSGSTLIACEKTKRRCFGIEIDPHYVSVIISRWCQYTGNKQVMINDKVVEWEEYCKEAVN